MPIHPAGLDVRTASLFADEGGPSAALLVMLTVPLLALCASALVTAVAVAGRLLSALY